MPPDPDSAALARRHGARLPVEPLVPYARGHGPKVLGNTLRKALIRAKHRGWIRAYHADEICVRLRRHPSEIWGAQWFELVEGEEGAR